MGHPFSQKWTLWAHLPHESNWALESYTKIMDITYVEDLIALTHTLPPILTTSCMLFFMRQGVAPMWEDPKNVKGGCFSYKVSNKNVPEAWRDVCYQLAGETLSPDRAFVQKVTGLSVSPKKGFCILKVWTTDVTYTKAEKISCAHLKNSECMFKLHKE